MLAGTPAAHCCRETRAAARQHARRSPPGRPRLPRRETAQHRIRSDARPCRATTGRRSGFWQAWATSCDRQRCGQAGERTKWMCAFETAVTVRSDVGIAAVAQHAIALDQLLDAGIERRSEEHTSELQSRGLISYAVF